MDSSKRALLLDFIQTYRNLPVLWDTNHKDYNNRDKKAKGYDILIQKLKKIEAGATRETVVKKINSLRSNFRKELRKFEHSKESGKNTDKIYTPSLWYFNEFLFLTDHPDPEQSRTTLNVEDYLEINEVKKEECNEIDFPSTTISAENVDVPFSITKETKKRNADSMAESIFAGAAKHLEQEDDEFLMMAKYYAQKLRKMEPLQCLFADRMINEVLLEGQLGSLSRYSSVTNPASNTVSHATPSTSFKYLEFE